MCKAKKILAVLFALATLSSTGLACTGYNALDLIKTGISILIKTPLHSLNLLDSAKKLATVHPSILMLPTLVSKPLYVFIL